uniref:PID domain-containing protein n=2 Tax=Clastoptera arizonana TaxID=38151 RepID=A0A1B6CRJ7_9HEMI
MTGNETKTVEAQDVTSKSPTSKEGNVGLGKLAHLKLNFKNFSATAMRKPISELSQDKNEPSRFLGEGVSFKAKLIGILEVSDPRGDRMCQEALADLKMAIRAAGEHKQRITINIAIDGLRLRDEKSGDCLYHHPVHKISFIAQDMSDSRAFGYIFGSPDTGHRFFGIKTDKAASQVVISMRDLFQVVFELKKKEIEMAKQHIEQHQIKYGMGIYTSDVSCSKAVEANAAASKLRTIVEDNASKENGAAKPAGPSEAIADLLDLEFELNSIQQGISQMERITPSDPFGDSFAPPVSKLPPHPVNAQSTSSTDTPPPGQIKERHWFDQETESIDTSPTTRNIIPGKSDKERHWFDRETEALFDEGDLTMSPPSAPVQPANTTFSPPPSISAPTPVKIVQEEKEDSTDLPKTAKEVFDVFTELDPLGTGKIKPYIDKKDFFQDLKNPPKKVLKDLVSDPPNDSNIPLFQADFDTSTQNVNITKDTVIFPVTTSSDPFGDDPFDKTDPFLEADFSNSGFASSNHLDPFDTCFADFKKFKEQTDASSSEFDSSRKTPMLPERSPPTHGPLRVSLPPEKHSDSSLDLPSPKLSPSPPTSRSRGKYSRLHKQTTLSSIVKLPSPKQRTRSRLSKQTTVDTFYDRNSPIMEGITLKNRGISTPSPPNVSLLGELAPEPPPRPLNTSTLIKPPPLPPKRQLQSTILKPPPRPPHSEDQPHYDYIESSGEVSLDIKSPPIPVPARRPRLGGDGDLMSYRPSKINQQTSSDPEYYLTPFPLLPPPQKKNSSLPKNTSLVEQKPISNNSINSLDITLSQLSKTGFSDLAATLDMSPTSLSKMTLQELTKSLQVLAEAHKTNINEENKDNSKFRTNVLKSEQYSALRESLDEDTPPFVAEFETHFDLNVSIQDQRKKSEESLFDKYAVFRELLEQEKIETDTPSPKPEDEVFPKSDVFQECSASSTITTKKLHSAIQPTVDRYAALRDICIDEFIAGKEDTISDKEDSITDMTRADDDVDTLASHPHSESTDSPTATVKESQSIMETTIMEEDISALDDDDDEGLEDIPEIGINLPTVEESNENVDASESPVEDEQQIEDSCRNMKENTTERNTELKENDVDGDSWARFETCIVETESIHSEGNTSPWSVDSKEKNSPGWRDQPERKPRKNKRYKPHSEWLEDDESEERWSHRHSQNSSRESPAWRENGWSDGDSMYDEAPPYDPIHHTPYHNQRRGRRRRKISPWRKTSRDPSPWEEDDRELSEDQWEGKRWDDSWHGRTKHRGSSWDEERRRDESRKRRSSPWSTEGDRRSSRESLAWEDDERYQRRNYRDRRRRRWEEQQSYSRNREWREQGRRNHQYYRDRSHESPWDDEFSEQGDEESPRCQTRKQVWARRRVNEDENFDRRYKRPSSREEQLSPDTDHHWSARKSQTLQPRKNNCYKKPSQSSPFEDDFTSHSFSYSIDRSPGTGSDVPSEKSGKAVQNKVQTSPDVFKKKDSFNETVGPSSLDVSKELNPRCGQHQYLFEDDFTPPNTRRCSGRSMSSDISEKQGRRDEELKVSDEVFVNEVNFSDKFIRSRIKENMIELNMAKRKIRNNSSCDVALGKSKGEIETVEENVSKRYNDRRPVGPDLKSRISNLRRTDSSSSLRKSESVNIFAYNSDPFDDDFFSSDINTLPRNSKEDKSKATSDPFKWTEAFSAFNFDQEAK